MDTTATRTAAEVIDRVRAARATAHQAAVEEIELAVEWARLHPCPKDEWPAHWGDPAVDESVTPLAGEGAPLVAEFAPAELAAALEHLPGRGAAAGRRRPGADLPPPPPVGPVQAGRVPVWRARAISRHTHDLGLDAVAFADRLITATPDKIRLVDAERLVEEARLYFDPDRALADEEHELARRGVWVKHRGNPATTDVIMTLETPDALAFDAAVGQHRRRAAALGDTEDLDLRRARAVGILADPQYAMDLLPDSRHAPTPAGQVRWASTCTSRPGDLTGGTGTGAVSIEKLGAVTTHLLTDWLARHGGAGGKVNLRPVLDLNQDWAVDQHDPPEAMREHVVLRDAHCVFPGCRRDSRGLRPRPHHPLRPPRRRRTTRPDPARRISRPCAGPITGSRPTPPGTTNAWTTAAIPGPRPPATSTTSTPPPAGHPTEEPDAPHPGPPRPGPPARPSGRESGEAARDAYRAVLEEPGGPVRATGVRAPAARPRSAVGPPGTAGTTRTVASGSPRGPRARRPRPRPPPSRRGCPRRICAPSDEGHRRGDTSAEDVGLAGLEEQADVRLVRDGPDGEHDGLDGGLRRCGGGGEVAAPSVRRSRRARPGRRRRGARRGWGSSDRPSAG